MMLIQDGVTYAGAAAIDVTPDFFETWDDLNGDSLFDGCSDDPDGVVCAEPFDDVNGNGWFDAVWIVGFSPLRPATGVHDSIEVRAVVLAQDGDYIALVGMDFVGLGSPRIQAARDALAIDSFDAYRMLAAASHNHQGPDTMGLWGDHYDFADPMTGMNEECQQRVTEAIEQTVRQAAGAMEPVTLRVGAQHMRDRDPYFTGARFGGKNPTDIMHGMIFDDGEPRLDEDVVQAPVWAEHDTVDYDHCRTRTGDIAYRSVLRMTDNYLSYIVPEPDFNTAVSLLFDDGNHHEDTVSPAHGFASKIQAAHIDMDAAW